jgi:hypothetical protein
VKRGAALPATLFALTMTSAMAVGGLYVSRRHLASTNESSVSSALLPAAERAVVSAVADWDSLARAQQPIGITEALAGTAEASVWATRTTEFEYLIVAEAVSRSRPTLHHRVALSVVVSGGAPRLPFPRAWAQLP